MRLVFSGEAVMGDRLPIEQSPTHPRRDLMKVAQYEVLGYDAKRHARPARDDRNVGLLASQTQLCEREQPVDRPVSPSSSRSSKSGGGVLTTADKPGRLTLSERQPSTSYWAIFIESPRDRRSPSHLSIAP
jgi:hypothetical protein